MIDDPAIDRALILLAAGVAAFLVGLGLVALLRVVQRYRDHERGSL